jgi:hypothetical protein
MSRTGFRVTSKVTSSGRALVVVLCRALFGWILLASAPALAEDRARAVLEFEGAPECTDAALLQKEVQRRSNGISWAPDGNGDVRIAVRLDEREDGYAAEVIVSRPREVEVRRAIAGGTCEEVIEGVSLVIAVSVRSPRTSEAPVLPSPVTPAQQRALPTPARDPFRFGAGVGAILVAGIAPEPMPGLEVFGDLAAVGEGWSPAFRIGFRHSGRSGFDAGSGKVAFRLDAAQAGICPIAIQPLSLLLLRPCVVGVGGMLEASGSELARNGAEKHPWFALGLAARAELRLMSALSLGLEGSAEFPLTPGRFWVDERVFHETSALTARGTLAVVTRF